MKNSLTNLGEYEKEGDILTIEDENITKILFENDEFKEYINILLTDEEINIENKLISFYGGDLLLSLHDATLNNFATISSSYNVIKPFNFVIKITNDDYKIENE